MCIAISDDGRTVSKVFRISSAEHRFQMVRVVYHGEYLYMSGPFKSNRDHTNFNMGRGEHFVMRFPIESLPN